MNNAASNEQDCEKEGIGRRRLLISANEILEQSPLPVECLPSNESLIDRFASLLLADYRSALAGGRDRVLFIVPVGPVGQFDTMVELAGGASLDRLTLILMDEYLGDDGNWISETDPLSFRSHAHRVFSSLPETRRPEIVVPNPALTKEVGRLIEAGGGVDVCYGGVGITGHLAFNDPVAGLEDPDAFAMLETRVVALSRETRLINSVTACRGNVDRIPASAVTVGMKEILGARRIRIFMNRDWQCAAIRKMLFGEITGSFPASLVRRHDCASVHVVEGVLDLPEPTLR
ncbi:MAG: hypothetical protein OXI87_08150 [Albidovulum sp.]|nr:hypothetical protein [Albidovulum sp.]